VEAGEANSNALFTNSAPQQEVYACGYCSAQFYVSAAKFERKQSNLITCFIIGSSPVGTLVTNA